MKVLVVTSEVTFVPANYNRFLEALFESLRAETSLTVDLVVLRNREWSLVAKAFALFFFGARRMGYNLLINFIRSFAKDRRVFEGKYGINIFYFDTPNSVEFHEFVKAQQVDVIVNARTRFIYKEAALKSPKLAALNIHHGLLPEYRGTMCDLWALFKDLPTGFTIHVMEKKIDDGAIVKRVETTRLGEDPMSLRGDFAKLISESSQQEGREMAKVLSVIAAQGTIPVEMDNLCQKPVYTKNPDRLAIGAMLKKGIRL